MRWMWGALIAAMAAGPAGAASQEEWFRCGVMQDSSARLACYDAYVSQLYQKSQKGQPQEATKNSAPVNDQQMTLAEIHVDYKSLKGKAVTTSGRLLVLGDSGMLGEEGVSTINIMVDFKKLDRQTKLDVYQNCGHGCSVTLTGKVIDSFMGPQIVPTMITLH